MGSSKFERSWHAPALRKSLRLQKPPSYNPLSLTTNLKPPMFDKMFAIITTAVGVDTLQHSINIVNNVNPSGLIDIIGTIVKAILAVAAVFHLFRKKKAAH